jgi:PH (Pleckstrin Homology) domain-containing protein
LGIGLATFGIVGALLAVFSFFLFLVTLVFTIMSFVSLRNAHYYITNQRVVREQGTVSKKNWELPLQYLSGVDFSQSAANRIRSVGNVYFHSTDRRNLSFVRVKEPTRVKQIVLEAKPRASSFSQPAQTVTREREVITRELVLIQCRSCSARYPQGTARCLTCGANL